MNLNYSEEHSILRDGARRLLAKVPANAFAAAGGDFHRTFWGQIADLGWLGLPFAEANGGVGYGALEIAIVAEELGGAGAVTPFIEIVVIAGGLIEALGTHAQRAVWLEPLINGTAIPVLAHLEDGARGQLDHVRTVAVRNREGYALTGEKVLVRAGQWADVFLVTALLDDQIALFAVRAGASGVEINSYPTVDGGRAADVRLSRVVVGLEDRIGEESILPTLEAVHDRAVAALCADAVGAMDALLAATVEYTKQRVQFGKPIASFQALQHRMAEMAVRCEEARASALLAALSCDASKSQRIRGVSGAKAKIGRASRHVAQEAIQLHGAMGFSQELPIGNWFKRLYAFENSFSSTRDHLDRYARVLASAEMRGNLLYERGES